MIHSESQKLLGTARVKPLDVHSEPMEEGARLWCWLVAKSESAAVRSPYAYRYISIKSETQMIRKPQARTVCNNRYRRTARALPVHSTR